jgi:hypothetical protein
VTGAEATWSQEELKELGRIMRRNFGTCRCGKFAFDEKGDLVCIDVCAGHRWLREPNRATRLFWIKRTAFEWILAEHIL